jgi:thiol:disulfide interchange protein DsbC
MKRPSLAPYLRTATLLFAATLAMAASAETEQEAKIRKTIEPRMGKNIKVDSVIKTPYAGLYEVRTNGDIFYTDENADYLVVGKVVDLHTYKDLTRERVDEIGGIHFADLPLEAAIKQVKGDGKRKIAVFEDPNCGYCKALRRNLQSLDNVTIYTFQLNILADDSAAKSKDIWCAPDRARAWDAWMLEGKPAPKAPENCATPNERILALGRQWKIAGTPTIFFADGSRVARVLDAAAIEQRLAAIKTQ